VCFGFSFRPWQILLEIALIHCSGHGCLDPLKCPDVSRLERQHASYVLAMIPHPSTGVQQWANQSHILSGGGGGSVGSRTPGRSASLAEKSLAAASQAQSRQPKVINLTGAAISPDHEHQAKKLKWDLNSCVDDKAAVKSGEWGNGGVTSRPPGLPGRGRPACSFQGLIAEAYGGSLQGGNPAAGSQASRSTSPPPFPTRPWKGTYPEPPGNGPTSQEASPEREVLNTPYRLEVPSAAPILNHDSKYLTNHARGQWNNPFRQKSPISPHGLEIILRTT
jgi:mediator of RNA polymerase II transcription subunit 12, fungi type